MAIYQWAEEHRPREKILSHGPSTLSDAELLALLLRTGSAGQSALDIAKRLLQTFGGLGEMARASHQALLAQTGIGPGKLAQWLACLEIGQRTVRAALLELDLLTDADTTQRYLIGRLRNRNEEIFLALFLNQANRLISDEIMSSGTVNEAAVYPRQIIKRALELNASNVIVAHNHPSGSLQASMADLELTNRLIQAMALVDIRLLDHVIVAGPAALSLRQSTRLFRT
jgi:DNA repair protein RadC